MFVVLARFFDLKATRLCFRNKYRFPPALMLGFALCSVMAQQPPPGATRKPPTQQPQGDIGIQVKPAAPPSAKKITPEEAQQLFASVDEILTWLGKDTGYPIKRKVKGELVSREQVAKYVEERLNEDEDAKRLERSEVVLKKFGLIPRGFDLHTFLVQLLKEQIAGYYDVKTKSMYLLDWLSPDDQKPVIAHELTHALQDQNFDLKTWESAKAAKGTDKEEYSYDEDEASTARSAVAEGQGMVALIDYMLRDSGKTLADTPQVAAMMRSSMLSNEGYPLLQQAPLMIRESLVFPYGEGLIFETSLLRKGKDAAFSGVFRRPPQDTHEILDVDAYLDSHPAHWLVLPDLTKELGPSYEKYDEGSMGQLDVRILIEQYSNKQTAGRLAQAWRGGAYYATANKDPKLTGTAKIGLLYLSRWASDDDANGFAKIYADSLSARYRQAKDRSKEAAFAEFCPGPDCLNSSYVQTEEGWVTIQPVAGSFVLVTESLDSKTVKALAQKVLTANPAQSIQGQMHSLTSPLRTAAVIQDAVGHALAKRMSELLKASAMPCRGEPATPACVFGGSVRFHEGERDALSLSGSH